MLRRDHVRRFLAGPAALVLGLAACGGPQCDADCHFERAKLAVENPDPALLDAAINASGDALARDLLRVRLATIHPHLGARLCADVTTIAAREKCQQVIGRPHLQGVPRE